MLLRPKHHPPLTPLTTRGYLLSADAASNDDDEVFTALAAVERPGDVPGTSKGSSPTASGFCFTAAFLPLLLPLPKSHLPAPARDSAANASASRPLDQSKRDPRIIKAENRIIELKQHMQWLTEVIGDPLPNQ